MNSHNNTGLLSSVLACNLNIIMIKDYFKNIAPFSKKKKNQNTL